MSRDTRRRSRAQHCDSSGFTLVELLVTMTILPLVIGAIAIAVVSILTIQPVTASRVSDAADAQTVSNYFDKDVQSAVDITTSSSVAGQCGPGVQLLGLEWNQNPQTGKFEDVVSYVEVKEGSSTFLVREFCVAGASSTPSTTTYVVQDLSASQPSPVVTPAAEATSAAAGWTSAEGVTGVTLSVAEPGSKYLYALTSEPSSATSTGSVSDVSTPTTSCGFATPGTGTYASTLCFVDFSSYNDQSKTGKCQQITAGISGTPFTLSLCLLTSATPSSSSGVPCDPGATGPGSIPATVAPCALPTYTSPPASEAFLGNNGFYTGVPGKPALYENAEGTTATVTITNIQVLDANGHPATGWKLVTGDAESTDGDESITWSSNQDLTLLPNSPTSPIGNTCADPAPGSGLTGLGTTQVTCASSVSSDKTGTVMLEASAPTSLTVTLVGTGLQACFVGVLLP